MLSDLLQYTRAIIALILFPLLLISCAKKSYVLQIGEGGSTNVSAGALQQELISGAAIGPFLYCSVPEDAKENPCPTVKPPESNGNL